MRLHVKCFYALMLILVYNFTTNITCNGKVQKRAIDFDEIADFADIVEPEPSHLKSDITFRNSLDKIRNLNLDLELPKEITRRYIPSTSENYVTARSSAATDTHISNYSDDMNRIISFRMKLFKARSKRFINKRKRYIYLPIVTPHGATLMVVLTTPRSTTLDLLGTKKIDNSDVTTTQISSMKTTNSPRKVATIPSSTVSAHTEKHIRSSSTNQGSSSQISHSDDEYPLFGADGFYSDSIEGNDLPLVPLEIQKRSKREAEDKPVPRGLEELLRVVPVNINEDRPHDTDGEIINKGKQSIPVVHITNIPHSSSSSKVPAASKKMQTSFSPTSSINPNSVSTMATTSDGNHLVTKFSSGVSERHSSVTPTSKIEIKPSYNSNPYRWENDIIKELNVKYKKDVMSRMSAAKFITPTVFAHLQSTPQKFIREDMETMETSTTIETPTTSVSVGGETTNLPVCKGKECKKLTQNFMVYNDTAGDCNKLANEEGGTGGYNIINNDETPTTSLDFKCPSSFTTTEVSTTTKSSSCDKLHPSVCEPSDEEEVEPCDLNLAKEAQKAASCQAEKKKKKKLHDKQKAKNKLNIDKRQITATLTNTNMHTPPSFGFQQPPSFIPNSDIQRALNLIVSTQNPSNYQNTYPSASISANQVSAIQNVFSTPAPPTQLDRVVKKSIDKCVVSSVIENLKMVDQKLADAVDPLHSAQEQLDLATRCEVTTLSCSDLNHGNGGGGGDLLADLSDAEKGALQRLAIKIISNQNAKLKRADGMPIMPVDQEFRDMAKRGIAKTKISPQSESLDQIDYDYADQDRLSRLQRDLSVAQEIEMIVQKIKQRQNNRLKRNILILNKNINDENQKPKSDEFGEENFGFDNDQTKLSRSLGDNNKVNGNNVEEYQSPKKKTKPKKLWRKLFGLTGNRNNNRFLDQDFPNSQSIQKAKKDTNKLKS
ncbi:uncharacterized protein [Atheta coriaria]|uniref:uncharacterized protein isoform X2 n=1 Tax=Dalotia coriaria TaxID=877792 RepID=UPI0031F3EE8C